MKYKILIISSLAFVFSCGKKQETTEETTKKPEVNLVTVSATQFKNMQLEFGELTSKSINDAIAANGMVDVPPEYVAMVSVPVNGFIKSLTHAVLPGKFVAKGSVLAIGQSMEYVQMQEDYLQAYTKNDFLEKEFERQKTLAAEDATAKRKLQEAESNLKMNKMLLKSMEAKLKVVGVNFEGLHSGNVSSIIAIHAPISGYVKTVNISTGKNFTPTDVLFELISNEHLHAELKVFEKDAYRVKEGQTVEFDDAKLGGKATAKVFLVGKNFEDATKTINVHVHFSDESVEKRLIPGQYLNGKILADSRSAITLPESAILRESDGNYVYTIENQTDKNVVFRKNAVKIGATQNGFVEIISPTTLKKVVIKGGHFIVSGGQEE